jgi:hypothetical protein
MITAYSVLLVCGVVFLVVTTALLVLYAVAVERYLRREKE